MMVSVLIKINWDKVRQYPVCLHNEGVGDTHLYSAFSGMTKLHFIRKGFGRTFVYMCKKNLVKAVFNV
jgi:hypothetical protein